MVGQIRIRSNCCLSAFLLSAMLSLPFFWMLDFIELPDRLNLRDRRCALPTVLNDSLGLMLVLVLPIIVSLLVVFLLLKRVWSDLRGRMKTDVNK